MNPPQIRRCLSTPDQWEVVYGGRVDHFDDYLMALQFFLEQVKLEKWNVTI